MDQKKSHEKHSKCMFTRPHTMPLKNCALPNAMADCMWPFTIWLLWFLFFIPKYFLYFSLLQKQTHNVRHGTQISQQPTMGTDSVVRKPKIKITNDNGHYIVNFVLDTPLYSSCQSKWECVSAQARVDSSSHWISSQKYVKWLSFIKTISFLWHLVFIYTRMCDHIPYISLPHTLALSLVRCCCAKSPFRLIMWLDFLLVFHCRTAGLRTKNVHANYEIGLFLFEKEQQQRTLWIKYYLSRRLVRLQFRHCTLNWYD